MPRDKTRSRRYSVCGTVSRPFSLFFLDWIGLSWVELEDQRSGRCRFLPSWFPPCLVYRRGAIRWSPRTAATVLTIGGSQWRRRGRPEELRRLRLGEPQTPTATGHTRDGADYFSSLSFPTKCIFSEFNAKKNADATTKKKTDRYRFLYVDSVTFLCQNTR